jgi:hypothetical protein
VETFKECLKLWLKTELDKHSSFKEDSDEMFYIWLRKKDKSEQDFFDRISNCNLVVAFIPIFLVFVLILNLIT